MNFKTFNEWWRPRRLILINKIKILLFLTLIYAFNANTLKKDLIIDKSTDKEAVIKNSLEMITTQPIGNLIN